jgi:protein-export chaperone SecB
VILTLTIEAKDEEKTVFLIELHQAGLFFIAGYSEEEFKGLVGSFCPNILFPYARETIASMVVKGGSRNSYCSRSILMRCTLTVWRRLKRMRGKKGRRPS